MRRRLPVLMTVALLALAGCGDDDDEGRVDVSGGGTDTAGTDTTGASTGAETTPAGPAKANVKVNETEFRLTPKNPTVSKAGVVQFDVQNKGNVVHALEVEGPGGEAKTDAIDPGGKATLKVDLSEAGRYEWYCPIGNHKEQGMRGVITVAGGGTQQEDDSGSDDSGGGGNDKPSAGY